MSKFFIKRPIVAMVIAILTVIVGAVTIASLPIAQSLEQLELEASVAADQQVPRHSREMLRGATTALRKAQTAPQQVSFAKSKAQAADSQIMEAKAQLDRPPRRPGLQC